MGTDTNEPVEAVADGDTVVTGNEVDAKIAQARVEAQAEARQAAQNQASLDRWHANISTIIKEVAPGIDGVAATTRRLHEAVTLEWSKRGKELQDLDEKGLEAAVRESVKKLVAAEKEDAAALTQPANAALESQGKSVDGPGAKSVGSVPGQPEVPGEVSSYIDPLTGFIKTGPLSGNFPTEDQVDAMQKEAVDKQLASIGLEST